jgi:hypothetical protein
MVVGTVIRPYTSPRSVLTNRSRMAILEELIDYITVRPRD